MKKIGDYLSRPIIIFSLVVSGIVIIVACGLFFIDQAQTAGLCSTSPINSATFIKTYHLLDLTDGFNVIPAKNGGYLFTGDTLPASGMGAAKPFIIKTDAAGNLLWSRWFASPSAALGAMSSRRIARLAVETTDGNIVMAADMMDFVDGQYAELKEDYGDIFVTKLNTKGSMLWSVMLGDYGLDRPQRIWALPGGGIMILGKFSKIGYGSDIADSDTVPKYSAFIKIDKNGKVQLVTKMAWAAEDAQRLADGSYIALANIAVVEAKPEENVLGPEVVPQALPTMIKLDSNLKTVWAKSLEMIPSAISAPTSYAGGNLVIGKTVIRMPGGDFRAVQSTPDGGFLAFGFGDLTLSSGLMTGVANSITSFSPRALLAVKFNAAGAYQWVKKLATNLTFGISSNDFLVTKTTDNQFVILQDVVFDSATVQAPDFKLQKEALANNIELIKTDADFNPRWAKKINIERDLSGYAVAPTADKGVVVAASLLTTKQHLVLGSLEPYKEAALIKVDANGSINSSVNVSDQPAVTVQDQSQYLVSNSMEVGQAASMKLNVNQKVKEKVSAIKNIARNICQYKKVTVAPVCSYLASNAADSSASGQNSPAAKTWAQISYDNAKAGKIESEKNQQIHDELLPILNQIFNSQVKMTDSMSGMWLTYYFPRLVTRADVEAVQKEYAALGYKIDESNGGNLWVSKIGRTLHLTFSIQSSMTGKLEVLF